MPVPEPSPNSATGLRSRAEEQLRHQPEELPGAVPDEAQLHELRVHRIELEMQNEQLRHTQGELEKAREHYQRLYDEAPVGYLTLNEQGLILAANLTSVQMLGVERSRLLTLVLSRFIFQEDQDTYYLHLRKAFNSSLSQVCEVRVRPTGGAPFYARLEILQANEEGDSVCHLTLSDVTEHKQAEQALRESQQRQLQFENQQRLHLAFEAGNLGAWDQDFSTGRIVCSDRACAMLDCPPGQSLSWESFLERLHPEDRPRFMRTAERSTRLGDSGQFEVIFRVRLAEGAVRWLRFAGRTFMAPNAPGKPSRRAGVLADITQQKETEGFLESRAQQLEIAVRERTTRLQEAVSELEHFSYTLAHDLRAPLRTMAGFSELLLAQCGDLSTTHRQYLLRSNAAALRMDQLILDALNYNKLVRHHFSLAPVDCGALLQQLVETYPEFEEARARITIVGPFPPVQGNPALLTQCFSNLLTNALKFVPSGRAPAVRIYAQDLGSRVRLWFEDNGIGIAEEHRDIIFKMFQRLNHDYEGTGIGLALVKKAAQRMHGEVGFESRSGHGSRFWLELHKAQP